MEKREATLVGIAGGTFFGILQAFALGPAGGIFMGLFFAVGLGVLLYCFANSKSVNKQISLEDSFLLPGEKILFTKMASLVVKPKNFGLDDFAFSDLLWAVGMKDKESLGGAIHLTNYRIIFKTHRFNRLRGMTSIFLSTIQQLENRSLLVFRKLAISTKSTKVEFVVGDVDQVINQIASARDQLESPTLDTLRDYVADYPEKCNGGLQAWDAINRLNCLFNLGKKTTTVARTVVNPMGVLSSIFISELFEQPLEDKYQQTFQAAEQFQSSRARRRTAA